MRRGYLAGLTGGVLVGALLFTLPSLAQFIGGGSVGAAGGGGGAAETAASILAKIITVDGAASTLDADTLDAMNSDAFLQSGVCGSVAVCANVTAATADHTCTANTTCDFGASGTGTTYFSSGNSSYGWFASTHAGDPDFQLAVQDGNVSVLRVENSVANLSFSTNGITAGALLDTVATTPQFTAGDGVQSDGTIDRPSFRTYGEGTAAFIPRDALALTVTSDATSTPLGASNTGAGTACRMSSAGGVTDWTPSETGAVDGMFWCCTNTGANAITMKDDDGVYEGPGSVVGQYDQVCFEYVTDRFIERSLSNNEP